MTPLKDDVVRRLYARGAREFNEKAMKLCFPQFPHFGLYKTGADVISPPLHHDTLPLRRRPGNAGPGRFAMRIEALGASRWGAGAGAG